MNETMVTVVGNVMSDVRSRETADGVKLASFRLASNERRFDKRTEQWVNGDHLYLTVTCWRKLANGVSRSLEKGDPVIVTGRLYTRGYEVEGSRRSVTEIEAYAVGPDLTRCVTMLRRNPREAVEDRNEAAEGTSQSLADPNVDLSDSGDESRSLQVMATSSP